MTKQAKVKFWFVFSTGFLLLAILWYEFLLKCFGPNFSPMMNALCILLPINVLLTFGYFTYIFGSIASRRKQSKKLPKSATALCVISAVLALLYHVLFVVPLYFVNGDLFPKREAFKQAISLKNLISSNYLEEDFEVTRAQCWGDTVYLYGEVRANFDKVISFDADVRAQFSENICARGETQYIQNVPKALKNQTDKIMAFRFDMDIGNTISGRDADLMEKVVYDGVDFTVYYDSHVDFQTNRIGFLAQYENDYMLFFLELEDDTGEMEMQKETVMQKVAAFMKEQP